MRRFATWVKRFPLLAYFTFVFVIEWTLFLLLLSSSAPVLIMLLIGSWLPNCAGVLVTGIALGKNGLRELFSKIILWRVERKWYAAALLLPVAACCLAIGWNLIIDSAPARFAQLNQIPLIFLGALITGAMGEELGWRGTALPLLQARWNPLQSSLVLGILWGLYHLPSFMLSGLPLNGIPFISFMMAALALTILVTWTYNHTSGSLLLVFLYHFSFNFIGNATGIFAQPSLFFGFSSIIMLLAVIVVAHNWVYFNGVRAHQVIEV